MRGLGKKNSEAVGRAAKSQVMNAIKPLLQGIPNPNLDSDRTKFLRKLQQDNPRDFPVVQEQNTVELNKLYNKIEFDMDGYKLDPISKRGVNNLPYTSYIPIGFDKTDKEVAGITQTDTGRVAFLGNPSRGIARHEAQHSDAAVNNYSQGTKFTSEAPTRSLDLLYAQANNDKKMQNDAITYLKKFGSKQLNDAKSIARFREIASDVRKTNIPGKLSNESPNTIHKEFLDFGELNARDKLGLLGNQYSDKNKNGLRSFDTAVDRSIRPQYRDLPNEGWYDKLGNAYNNYASKYKDGVGMPWPRQQ